MKNQKVRQRQGEGLWRWRHQRPDRHHSFACRKRQLFPPGLEENRLEVDPALLSSLQPGCEVKPTELSLANAVYIKFFHELQGPITPRLGKRGLMEWRGPEKLDFAQMQLLKNSHAMLESTRPEEDADGVGTCGAGPVCILAAHASDCCRSLARA